jgi:putative peptide zinc metalloprotease protein
VSWFEHPDGHWIVRNREDMKFLQVDNRSKAAIEQLGHLPPAAIIQQQNITPAELRYLLQLLAATGMLEGTTPAKPPKRKFTPLSLLFFKVSLFNPDKWLTQHIDTLRWIWTRTFGLILCFFLAWSLAIGLSLRPEVIFTGQQLIASQGTSLILPFALLAMLVVTLHELGHAFHLEALRRHYSRSGTAVYVSGSCCLYQYHRFILPDEATRALACRRGWCDLSNYDCGKRFLALALVC